MDLVAAIRFPVKPATIATISLPVQFLVPRARFGSVANRVSLLFRWDLDVVAKGKRRALLQKFGMGHVPASHRMGGGHCSTT